MALRWPVAAAVALLAFLLELELAAAVSFLERSMSESREERQSLEHVESAPPTRPLKIYVYELRQDQLSSMRVDDRERARVPHLLRDYRFDMEFRKLMRQNFTQRVWDPSEADFFYVPVDAVSFYRAYDWQLQRLAELKVVEQLRAVGPYWDTLQERHIVPSLRCPRLPGAENPRWSRDYVYPQLWGGKALRLCLEAIRDQVDVYRSLHVGYFVPEEVFDRDSSEVSSTALTLRPNSRSRDLLATFMGSPLNGYRADVDRWLSSRADCRTIKVLGHSNESRMNDTIEREYHEALSHSRFQIDPPGDTPERMSRDVALVLGAVPVFFDFPSGWEQQQQYLPWHPALNWSSFSVNFTLTAEEARGNVSFAPRLERRLQDLVASGEADVLLQGVARVRERLRWSEDGVLRTVLEMLTWRKELPCFHDGRDCSSELKA